MATGSDDDAQDPLGWLAASDDFVTAWTTTTDLLRRVATGEPVDADELVAARRDEARALLDVVAAIAANAAENADRIRRGLPPEPLA